MLFRSPPTATNTPSPYATFLSKSGLWSLPVDWLPQMFQSLPDPAPRARSPHDPTPTITAVPGAACGGLGSESRAGITCASCRACGAAEPASLGASVAGRVADGEALRVPASTSLAEPSAGAVAAGTPECSGSALEPEPESPVTLTRGPPSSDGDSEALGASDDTSSPDVFSDASHPYIPTTQNQGTRTSEHKRIPSSYPE